jgi:hypothetical protein
MPPPYPEHLHDWTRARCSSRTWDTKYLLEPASSSRPMRSLTHAKVYNQISTPREARSRAPGVESRSGNPDAMLFASC